MRYLELVLGDKVIKDQTKIETILKSNGFLWMIDSEIENAKIQIKNNTLIWYSGDYFSGNWHYGIFKSGKFSGNWINGIFEDGIFRGKWISGINQLS